MYETICNHIVQNGSKEDEVLHKKGFDVNMNLFKTSPRYKGIISFIINHMWDLLRINFPDYGKIRGISGANVGVPFNIVAIKVTEGAEKSCGGKKEGSTFFMINPRITSKSRETKTVRSNCGSIRLPKKIGVKRHEWIRVVYYDTMGKRRIGKFDGSFGSTIQHEIDHNLGVLITDKLHRGRND